MVLDCLEQRPLEQELFRENVLTCGFRGGAFRFERANLQDLPRIVPFIDGRANVKSLLTLQAYECCVRKASENLGDFSLADPCFPFKEKRFPELKGDKNRGGETAIDDVLLFS